MHHLGLYPTYGRRRDRYSEQDDIDYPSNRMDNLVNKFLRPAQAVPACDTGQASSQTVGDKSDLQEDGAASSDPSKKSSSEDHSVASLAGQLADTNVTHPTTSGDPSVLMEDVPGSSGVSPKRKASESDDPSGGEPASKVEKRGDIDELVRQINRYKKVPLTKEEIERYHLLPSDVIDTLREELFFCNVDIQNHKSERRRRRQYDYRYDDFPPPPPPPPPPQDDLSSSEDDVYAYNRQYALNISTIPEGKFPVSQRQKLLRLLILGGQKYKAGSVVKPGNVSNEPLKKPEEFSVISTMIAQGEGVEVVEILKDVSVKGRSPKQDGLLFSLAMCCRSKDLETKTAAYNAIQEMCRTPTQIFQIIKYIENLDTESSGWGRGLRRALNQWYNNYADNPMRLAMHITKYWSRHEWNHRDVFRLSHIKPADETIGFIVRYCVKDMEEAQKHYLEDGYLDREGLKKVHEYLKAVEETKRTTDVSRALELIEQHRLVREQLRTELLNEVPIWNALLKEMPLMALLRNLGKMTSINMFDDPENLNIVLSKLSNQVALKKARIHPIKVLLAHHTYKTGHGEKGSLTWNVRQEIVSALEKAFYDSFGNVKPTNKRILIALDISGSMTMQIAGCPFTAREAATVMAMLTARVEPNCDIVGFHNKLLDLNLLFKNSNKTLENLMECTNRLSFGLTDCAKPMVWALKHKKEYDAFIIYTDAETNAHKIAPHDALDKYREGMNIPTAKLVVVAITSNDFTIARPNDLHMLDVVGFDPDTPDMLHEFLSGGLE